MLGLRCLNKEWRIIYRAKAIDRHLIRHIIWAEISRTFGKLLLYMNRGRLHKKNKTKTKQWSREVKALDSTLHPELMCQQSDARCWRQPLPHLAVMQREECHLLSHLWRVLQPLSVCRCLCPADPIPPASGPGVFQVAPRYHVPATNTVSDRREWGGIQPGKWKGDRIPFPLTPV